MNFELFAFFGSMARIADSEIDEVFLTQEFGGELQSRIFVLFCNALYRNQPFPVQMSSYNF